MASITALANDVKIPTDPTRPDHGPMLAGTLIVPTRATGLVVFAHGAGSSRLSPRNVAVAEALRSSGAIGTLLFDLLTPTEDQVYERRFDISLLTERLAAATDWVAQQPVAQGLKLGYFGASTGAAAALDAAARFGDRIAAVVSRGGRPDLATSLPQVQAPTLLIVGGHDPVVYGLNEDAYTLLGGEKEITVVPGATHLFEEPGALEQVSALALQWFERHLAT
jgi:pimeloyl-ACP methyl ester carboxylesterase